jgi:redox-sensitive bicupin YhaK (pirin superfamily)
VSNLETQPAELACTQDTAPGTAAGAVEILQPRLVPLGGPRAMTVRRTLPQRQRSLIGGWCFADHYGPDQVAGTGGMRVPPHPHTQLQTASWLFAGEVEHRDSAGHHALVRPGELNLMTAGRGISHSEVSTAATTVLHGAQLWVALPSAARFTEPGFQHYVPEPVPGGGFTVRVFIGSMLGSSSPVTGYSPLLGAELSLDPGAVARLPVQRGFEHGVLVDTGTVTLNAAPLRPAQLGYAAPGSSTLELRAGTAPARVLLLGGEPLGERIVMWWNFIGRTHDEIVAYRTAWQSLITPTPASTPPPAPASDPGASGTAPGASAGGQPGQFSLPVGDPLPPIPAPPLPNATLRPRG